ncbi:hypothetical protein LIER_42897 [Lithospermum erythrorhizon]
MDVFCI